MQTLAEMLSNATTQKEPVVSKRTAFEPDNVLLSFEKNSHKSCTKCHKPRHRAKSGRIYTTLCTEHYKSAQALQRVIRKGLE